MKILLALSGTVLSFVIAFCLTWLSTKGLGGVIATLVIMFLLSFVGLYCLISQ